MSENQLELIQSKLNEFDVKKIDIVGNVLKLQIQVDMNSDVKIYEKLIKERLPEYVVQIVFFSKDNKVKQFKKIIGISSGKGGVGKSIVSLNLAFTIRDLGYSVGILDADIYTPSIPGLLKVKEVPQSSDGVTIDTIKSHGLEVLSMGLFLEYNQSPLWQENMMDASFRQFLIQGGWNCDYLIIDFAAGLSSLYDTCTQLIPEIELVLVSNPNCLVYRDVFRMYSFLKGMNLKVLGVIDNMSDDIYKLNEIKEFGSQSIPNLGNIPYFKHYIDLINDGYPNDYKLIQDDIYFSNLVKKFIL